MRFATLLSSAAFACASLAVATPAAAQLASSRSGSSGVHLMSADEGWRELISFGRCYAAESSKNALQLLETTPGSREEVAVYRALFSKRDQGCLGTVSRMSASLPMIRGVIAEGMYQRRIALPEAMKLGAPAPGEIRNLGGAARCYVAANHQQARALLLTKPGSAEEYEAVTDLMPAFGKCIPEGARFEFSATLIRFRIVEAMFRAGATAEKN